MFDPGSPLLLRFAPRALERCFLVADVLLELRPDEISEYGLIGLAAADEPLRVLATPLLNGQRVTRSTVEQPGRAVLRMRREIDALSAQLGRRLVPIVFVHRHPRSVTASRTDLDFLSGVFLDQVSTLVSFPDAHRNGADASRCACERASAGVEVGLAFSLIVNAEREHRLHAAFRRGCPACGWSEVGGLPARVAVDGAALSGSQRRALRESLADEIRAKVEFSAATPPAEAAR